MNPVIVIRVIFMCSLVPSITYCNKNVLFIAVDDLRPELEPYAGRSDTSPLYPNLHTPNIDALAKKSIVFHNSYVQQPLCAPSRTSILTGRRPDTTRVHGFHQNFRVVAGNFTTLPQFFKNKGYHTSGFGKIFHNGEDWYDDPISWSEPFWRASNAFEGKCCSWHAIPDANLTNKPLRDTQVADRAIDKLRSMAPDALSGTKPFFLAAGFYKPHLPFVFPESFLQFYPEDAISLPNNLHAPRDMPEIAWSDYVFLLRHDDIKALNITGHFNTTIPTKKILELRRAYYSSITYVDNEIGRLLNELENLRLSDTTVIVFWSDHGYHLGENGEWCKHTAFELSAWAPLMFSIPGVTDAGIHTNELVEHVDIFPTLLDAAGHEVPDLCPDVSNHIALCVEGISLLPLVKSPDYPIKNAAFTQTVRPNNIMGYSLRTKKFRYIVWVKFSSTISKPNWKTVVAKELYDHRNDPNENYNVIEDERYKSYVRDLDRTLRQGWRKAIIRTNDVDIEQKPNNHSEKSMNESWESISEGDSSTKHVKIKYSETTAPTSRSYTDDDVTWEDKTTLIKTSKDPYGTYRVTTAESLQPLSGNTKYIGNDAMNVQSVKVAVQISTTDDIENKQITDAPHSVSDSDTHIKLVQDNSKHIDGQFDGRTNEIDENEPNRKIVTNDNKQSKGNDDKTGEDLSANDIFKEQNNVLERNISTRIRDKNIVDVHETKEKKCCSFIQTIFMSVLMSLLSVVVVLSVLFCVKKFKRFKNTFIGYKYQKLSNKDDDCPEIELL